MRFDRLTKALQHAFSDAQSLAISHNHTAIESVHLLLSMLDASEASIKPLLQQSKGDTRRLYNDLQQRLVDLPHLNAATGDVSISPDLARIMNLADKFAQDKGDQFISTEAVVYAMLENGSDLLAIFLRSGFSAEQVAEVINELRAGESVDANDAENHRQALEKYTLDLTARAEQGQLDPVIGRDVRAYARRR